MPRRAFLTHFWPDRTARNRRMDVGRQTRSAVPIANAQIYLVADGARGLSGKAQLEPPVSFVYVGWLPPNQIPAFRSNENKMLTVNYFAKVTA